MMLRQVARHTRLLGKCAFASTRNGPIRSVPIVTQLNLNRRYQSNTTMGSPAVSADLGAPSMTEPLAMDDHHDDKIQESRMEGNEVRSILSQLDKAFTRFEALSQNSERVAEKNFVRTFDSLTKAVEKLEAMNRFTDGVKSSMSVYTAILLRCCGSLMIEAPEKVREMLAANLWEFINAKKIPLDISHYNGLIRVLNENKTNFDPQKLLDEIQQANLTPDRITYQRLIHRYCLQGDVSGATKLLETMKSSNMELTELTFASLIIGYSKQENPPAIEEMLELMKSNGIEPTSKSYIAAINSQLNLLSSQPSAAQELEKILKLIEAEDIQFNVNETIDLLNNLELKNKDELAARVLDQVFRSTNLRSINDDYRLNSTLLKTGEYEAASKLYWAKRHTEVAMRHANLGTYYIKLLIGSKSVPDEFCLAECVKLKEKGHNSKAYLHLYYYAASNGRLSLVKEALEKLKEEGPVKCQFYWPLLAQAESKEAAIKVLKEHIQDQKMRSDDLLETFSLWVWPKFSDNFVSLFEINNKELNFDNNLLIASFIQYSIVENKIMEAIKFISDVSEDLINTPNTTANEFLEDGDVVEEERQELERDEVRDNSRVGRRSASGAAIQRGRLIGRLLDQIAEETKDPDMVTKAYNMCKGSGNQKMTSRRLNALVKVHLLNQNPKKAIEVFLELCQEHGCTPCKKDLIIHCLENKDPDNLQKIMNASSGIHGEMNSLFDLAVCCLECGKLKQAQKIFASPGFRVNPTRVYETSRNLAQRANLEILENFVQLTRGMIDVDQEQLYNVLINAYDKASNGKQVLSLWNKMQEEDFYPGKRSLLMIAKVLEKHNIKVPFQKPVMDLRLNR